MRTLRAKRGARSRLANSQRAAPGTLGSSEERAPELVFPSAQSEFVIDPGLRTDQEIVLEARGQSDRLTFYGRRATAGHAACAVSIALALDSRNTPRARRDAGGRAE